MIELKNVTFEYGSAEGAAGGIGETVSNGSLKNINLRKNLRIIQQLLFLKMEQLLIFYKATKKMENLK